MLYIHKITHGMQAFTATIYEAGTGFPYHPHREINVILQGCFPHLFQNIERHFHPNNSNTHFYTTFVFSRPITKTFWEKNAEEWFFLVGQIIRIVFFGIEIFAFLHLPTKEAVLLTLILEIYVCSFFVGMKRLFSYGEFNSQEKITNWKGNWEYYQYLNQKLTSKATHFTKQSLSISINSLTNISLPLDKIKYIISFLDDPSLEALSACCRFFYDKTKQEKILRLQKQITPYLETYLTCEQIKNLFMKEKSKWVGFFPNHPYSVVKISNVNGLYHHENLPHPITKTEQMISYHPLFKQECHWVTKEYSITVFINLQVINNSDEENFPNLSKLKYLSITKFGNNKAVYLARPSYSHMFKSQMKINWLKGY